MVHHPIYHSMHPIYGYQSNTHFMQCSRLLMCWANVGYHRDPSTKEVVTPNIDSLVADGLELDQHYAFQVCSPSRSSLISRRLPIHVCDINIPPNHYNPSDPVSGFEGIRSAQHDRNRDKDGKG